MAETKGISSSFRAAEGTSSPLFSKVDLATHQLLKSQPCLSMHFSVLRGQGENPVFPSSFRHGGAIL